jgi:prophage antirepressor-like protein
VVQKREQIILNEPGLYRLIFQSRKPEAERFKTWVFTEVLPQIRKTGRYTAPGIQTEAPLPESDIRAFNTFVKESVPRVMQLVSEKDRLRRENRIYQKMEQLREQLARKNTPLTDNEKERIRIYSKHWSIAEIARFMGRSSSAISRVIKGEAV